VDAVGLSSSPWSAMDGRHPGRIGQVFSALGAAAVERALIGGASEDNISVVVEGKQATRAQTPCKLHLSPTRCRSDVAPERGPGAAWTSWPPRRDWPAVRTCGAQHHDSRRMLLSDRGVDCAWKQEFDAGTVDADMARFVEHLKVEYLPHTVIIDCSADESVARHYRDWLAHGIHVLTPNKKDNSDEMTYYDSLREARRIGGSHYLYEGTVGAGLPVVQTLRDLRETGDEIESIEGIFSGTLAYLFNVYDGTVPFSAIVREAKQRGYTEPDPRDLRARMWL
jgi:aspartokinase/homoserine dehydrogenase 1